MHSLPSLGFRFNGAGRANTCASTAIDASIGIDDVDVSLADSIYRALTDARPTRDTVIMNYMCHDTTSYKY